MPPVHMIVNGNEIAKKDYLDTLEVLTIILEIVNR